MQPDVPTIPHNLAQVLWLVLASSLGWLGGWIARRKREPAEIAKIFAETKQIHVTAESSQTSIGLETLREIQVVIDKAEQRREQWLQKEEQLRHQLMFWKNKAEELDGELADSRQANGLYDIRLKHHENQEKKLKALLDYHGIGYAELDRPRQH